MYKFFIRPILFLFDPEKIHYFIFDFLKFMSRFPGGRALLRGLYDFKDEKLERRLFGLTFKNPVGLAAGFDKNASHIDELAALGFGFIEIGTLTPRPQPGNEKPRLFRLKKDAAIINRMGFNNDGVLKAIEALRKRKSKIIVGGNIGKNKVTPNDEAADDYAYCFEQLFPYVDYFVVNVSSPNTPGLRELQEKEPLKKLLSYVKKLSASKSAPKPVLLKIAPDLNEDQLMDIVAILSENTVDGLIATNTTISREGLTTDLQKVQSIGAGGLSGAPLTERSTEIIRFFRKKLGKEFPIIGVGGIMTAADALAKIEAGADLIQLYTGFIYQGPSLVSAINKEILKSMKKV